MDFKEGEKKGKKLCNLVILLCGGPRQHINVFTCQSGKKILSISEQILSNLAKLRAAAYRPRRQLHPQTARFTLWLVCFKSRTGG